MVVPFYGGGKSSGRALEPHVINALRDKKFPLWSTCDARHRRYARPGQEEGPR